MNEIDSKFKRKQLVIGIFAKALGGKNVLVCKMKYCNNELLFESAIEIWFLATAFVCDVNSFYAL